MKKLLAVAFLAMLTFAPMTQVNSNEEAGLAVVEVVEETPQVVEQEPVLSFHERLEYQVSRGEIRAIQVTATAYTASEDEGGEVTATGKYAERGMIAVDPRVIPLGARVYVEGYGYATAEDTGSAIKGHKIDLVMDSKSEAYAWGRKSVKVYIF